MLKKEFIDKIQNTVLLDDESIIESVDKVHLSYINILYVIF